MKWGNVRGFFGLKDIHLKRNLRRRFFKPARQRLQIVAARAYRRVLGIVGPTCFIGVTGSCGKTTACELLAAVLSRQGKTRCGIGANATDAVAETVLMVRPWHDFCVNEVSAHQLGVIGASVKVLRPEIAVVTNINGDHYGEYRSLEATAAEKVKLVESLRPDGVAVLNRDDEYVYSMRHRTKGLVLTYGLHKDADVRAENVSSEWPHRLSMDVFFKGKSSRVQTQLLGEHWKEAVLAALSAALAAGVPLERIVEAIASVEPIPSRMSEHVTPDGVTFLRDDFKAPYWTVPACIEILRNARANRKILVLGSISDTPKSHWERQKAIIRQARGVADKIVFVGNYARSALKAGTGPEDDCIMAFGTLLDFDLWLQGYLQSGDLVMLKGARRGDHFDRLVLSRTNNMVCWRQDCRKDRFCHACRHHNTPAAPADPVPVAGR